MRVWWPHLALKVEQSHPKLSISEGSCETHNGVLTCATDDFEWLAPIR
jgi:hypothetical protein